jgi:hypothetical protein
MKISWLLRSLAAGAAGAAVLGLTGTVQAAPYGITTGSPIGEAHAARLVQRTGTQQRAWRYGARPWGWTARPPRAYRYAYGPRFYNARGFYYGPIDFYGYGYGYGPSFGFNPAGIGPDAYPTGSTQWWRQMDREGRGGQSN